MQLPTSADVAESDHSDRLCLLYSSFRLFSFVLNRYVFPNQLLPMGTKGHSVSICIRGIELSSYHRHILLRGTTPTTIPSHIEKVLNGDPSKASHFHKIIQEFQPSWVSEYELVSNVLNMILADSLVSSKLLEMYPSKEDNNLSAHEMTIIYRLLAAKALGSK